MAETTIKFPVFRDGDSFDQAGVAAVQRVYLGHTLNVCSPEFGADPTGKKDSTPAIQAVLDKLHELGGGTAVIPAGIFRVDPKGLRVYGYTTVMGSGIGSTRLIVDSSKVADATIETGVFHTGSYNQRVEDRGCYRITIRDLSIFTSYKNGGIPLGDHYQHQHIAATEHMNSKVWGIVFNTYLGEAPADPDAVHTVENVEIWDTAGGVALLGLDDQGCKLTNIRVRRTWKQGLLVGKPFEHPEAYEANPSGGNPYRRTGAADNKFVRMDISGGNQARAGYAGIEVYTAQSMFELCTSWYHGRSYAGTPNPGAGDQNIWNLSAATSGAAAAKPGEVNLAMDRFRYTRDGAGWYISGTRNEFANCTSQETGGHGWVMIGALCTYSHCRGESASYYGTTRTGSAKTSEAAAFLVTNWAWGNHLLGCIAQNAYKRDQAAKYGYYIQNYAQRLRLRDCFAQNMPYTNGTDATGGENNVVMPASPGANVLIQVEDQELSTLTSTGGPGSGGSSTAPAAPALTPAEIGSIVAHWDFSDTSKITSEGGRISSIAPVIGTAELAQAEEAKRPYLSALAGRTAVKTIRAESLHLQVPTIGNHSAADGYTIAFVGSINSTTNAQYIVSAGSSAHPVAITTTSGLAIRANSGGGSAGTTALSADKAVTLYAPAVVIISVNSTGVTLRVNGVTVAQSAGDKKIADLVGTFTLGGYRTGGTDAADATIGEMVVFSKILANDEAAGLGEYLSGKWR